VAKISVSDLRGKLGVRRDSRQRVYVGFTIVSQDDLRSIRAHFESGGVFYYNTTGSDDVLATGLSVFPFGLRVANVLAVSDSPVVVDRKRWFATLSKYRIDGEAVFDSRNAPVAALLAKYKALANSLAQGPLARGMESLHSMRTRIKKPLYYHW
jgi:hypothetical protein